MKGVISNITMERKVNIEQPPLTDKDIMKIVETIRTTRTYQANTAGEFLRVRDSTIVLFGALTGLRPQEILSLKWKDIDFENRRINIDPGVNKQRNGAAGFLNTKASRVLMKYKTLFDDYLNLEYVFPSLFTLEPMSTAWLERRFRELLKEAKIHKVMWVTANGKAIPNYSPYSLRKYYGTRVYRKTKDVYLTMRALRQKQMRSVEPYILQDVEEISQRIDDAF